MRSVATTNPPHPRPPAQIYIPDFSKGPTGGYSGFSGGKNASDAPLWLSVFEEYGTGSVSSSTVDTEIRLTDFYRSLVPRLHTPATSCYIIARSLRNLRQHLPEQKHLLTLLACCLYMLV